MLGITAADAERASASCSAGLARGRPAARRIRDRVRPDGHAAGRCGKLARRHRVSEDHGGPRPVRGRAGARPTRPTSGLAHRLETAVTDDDHRIASPRKASILCRSRASTTPTSWSSRTHGRASLVARRHAVPRRPARGSGTRDRRGPGTGRPRPHGRGPRRRWMCARVVSDEPPGTLGQDPDGEQKIILPGLRRVIPPKTPGQREYLRAIAQNDIVVGIGPAGTGKTYLAVAAGGGCAVAQAGATHHPRAARGGGGREPGIPARATFRTRSIPTCARCTMRSKT